MPLTGYERLVLANQYRILEKLYPQEDFSLTRQAIENGWGLQIEELLASRDGLTRAECVEVIDILDMFSVMKRSYDEISDHEDTKEFEVQFLGFDGNNEPGQLGYARYLIEGEGKFVWLKRGPSPSLNSHMPTLDRYRRMLASWKKSGSPYSLTKEQLHGLVQVGRG